MILVTFFLVYINVLLYSLISNSAPEGCKCVQQNQLQYQVRFIEASSSTNLL